MSAVTNITEHGSKDKEGSQTKEARESVVTARLILQERFREVKITITAEMSIKRYPDNSSKNLEDPVMLREICFSQHHKIFHFLREVIIILLEMRTYNR